MHKLGLALVLLVTSSISLAGNIQSLRTDSDGNIVASVRGEGNKVLPFYETYSMPAVDTGVFLTGTITFTRIGKLVTLSTTLMTHSAGSTITSGAGVVPERFRPSDDVSTCYIYDDFQGRTISVYTTGSIQIFYRNESSGVPNATTGKGIVITYTVD